MKTASRKAKGRSLQKYVCALILETFPDLHKSDVLSRPMGSQGSDIILSNEAKQTFGYCVECKNQESFKSIYDAYEQSAKQKEEGEPLLVLKMNRKNPLVVLDLEHFIKLVANENRD